MNLRQKLISLLSIIVLVSCGGGGGGGSSEPTPPPLPRATVNLTADPLSVLAGNDTTLTWSTANATTCNASGAWSGSKATSGSEAITINTTGDNQFTLSCSGPGGTGSDSVTVEGYENATGFVVDGYITGAEVFIDQDGNFISDSTDESTQSDSSGNFVIKKTVGDYVSIGGTDFDTQNSLDNLLLWHKTYEEFDPKAITPVTSVASFLSDPTNINDMLGLASDINVFTFDPVANLGDSGPFDHVYEKGNQLTVMALSILNATNEISGATDTTEIIFLQISEEMQNRYVETGLTVDIEAKNFIEALVERVIAAQSITIDQEYKTNLITAISSLIPIIQVKNNPDATKAIFNFSLTTFIQDIKEIANGQVSEEKIEKYEEDILEYVADDQNIGQSEIAPEITANEDLVFTDEDQTVSINVLANDSFSSNAPIQVAYGNVTNGSLEINGSSALYTPEENYNGDDSFTYVITQGGLTSNSIVNIKINPSPDSPVFTSPSTFEVPENQLDVTTLTATDADGDEVVFSKTGIDSASFVLEQNSGLLRFNEAPDFETKSSYGLIAQASDGNNVTEKELFIAVSNVNDIAPEITSGQFFNIDENSNLVGTITATDAEGDTLSFSISGTELTISSLGELSFIEAPDYETKNVYVETVVVSDGLNNTEQAIQIDVRDINEPPYLDGFDELTFTITEKESVIAVIPIIDPEGETATAEVFDLVGFPVPANFNLVHNSVSGKLQFGLCDGIGNWDDNCSNDYEQRSFYEGKFVFTDGVFTVSKDLIINITDVNETPSFGECVYVGTNPPPYPTRTFAGQFIIDENTTTIGILNMCDPEGDDLTFTSNNPLYEFNNETKTISLKSPIDFETMDCSSGDGKTSSNCWGGLITSSDGELTDEGSISVLVRNINDTSPIFTSTEINSFENESTIGQILASDPDGDQLSYEVDGSDFTITEDGILSFASIIPDYETKSVYTALVTVSDGTFSTQENITINILNVDEAPVVLFESSVFVPENQEYIVTFSAYDPENTLITFRSGCNLWNGGSVGSQFCNVESGFFDFPNCEAAPVEENVLNEVCSGELHFKTSDVPDYENPVDSGNNNNFGPIFYVEDNSGIYGMRTAFRPTINVTNVNDNSPIFVSSSTFSINENQTNIGSVVIEDADEDEITYSTSSSEISIDSNGALTFNSAPNYELKNLYTATVTASDGLFQADQNITINIIDVDEGTTNSNVACDIFVSNAKSDEFRYCWEESQDNSGSEYSANINEPISVTFEGSAIDIPDISYAELLYSDYGIILSDGDVVWTNDYAYALYESVKKTPLGIQGEGEDLRSFSNWTLTEDFITDDITLTSVADGQNVLLSTVTFTNANPKIAVVEGKRGKFFSNRLFKAVVRFISNNGSNLNIVNQMLSDRYGVSISIDDYQALTGEASTRFQDFQPEELVEIIAMFEEMPSGYHKVQGLNYLVRRLNGGVNEFYPEAPAIAWVGSGYIEFMESGFDSSNEEYVHRLILHEKAHFLWGSTHDQSDDGVGIFDATLKADWIELGGWYECTERESGWCTTKQTEFVSAYAHSKNPNEDMAESLSFFVVNPDALRSRALAKYEFVRDRVMQGNIYISQIRDDLTFQVYNLYPDYVFPGKIKKLQVSLIGAPTEDKSLVVEVELHALDEVLEGAASGFMRVFSSVGTFVDFYLNPYDGNNVSTKLRSNPISFSKFVKGGFWKVNNITLTDAVGNIRNFGANDFGWRLHINSPLEDITKPAYVDDSIAFTKTSETIQDQAVDILNITWDTIETNPRENQGCYGTVNDEVITTYSLERYSPEFYDNSELYFPNQCYLRYVVPNYMPSGTYSISYAKMFDKAGNVGEAYFQPPSGSINDGWDNPDDPSPTVTFETSNPDTIAPELDLNDIGITAVPTNPDAPNGETIVTFRFRVKDDISGYQIGTYYLRDPQGTVFAFYHYPERRDDLFPSSEDLDWYEYESTVILPPGSAPGTWGVSELTLRDRAQNYKTYNFTEIVSFVVDN